MKDSHRLKGLTLEFSDAVLGVDSLIMEGREVTSAVRWSGKRWLAVFDEFELGSDNDLDVYAELRGPPRATCRVTVTVAGKEPKKLPPQRFDNGGHLIVNEVVEPGALKDAS